MGGAERNQHIDAVQKEPPTPLEVAQKKYEKERGDVINTLNSIDTTITGIIKKGQKVTEASTKTLKNKYQRQIKDSRKFLNQLFETLELEMFEECAAKLELEKLGG